MASCKRLNQLHLFEFTRTLNIIALPRLDPQSLEAYWPEGSKSSRRQYLMKENQAESNVNISLRNLPTIPRGSELSLDFSPGFPDDYNRFYNTLRPLPNK